MNSLRLLRIAQAIAINAVLFYGLLRLGWSASTIMVLFWFENVLSAILVGIRIDVHRRLTNKSGHYVLNTWTDNSGTAQRNIIPFSRRPLFFALVATIAQAVFVGLLVVIGGEDPSIAFHRGQCINGAVTIGAVSILGFIADLATIRRRPFAWIKLITRMMVIRVIVVQLVIVFGLGLAAAFNAPRFVVILFLVFKLGIDFINSASTLINEAEEQPFDDAARARLLAS